MKKRTKRPNWHSVGLTTEAHDVLKKARGEIKAPAKATYSAAVLALAKTTQTVAAPTSALIDLQSQQMQAPIHHFTIEQSKIPGCSDLREAPISTAALIEQAAQLGGRTPQDFVVAAVAEAARKAVIDHRRAKAGATNAKGSADAKILAAIQQLKDAGETPTVARVRAMTGCNRVAVLRHFQPIPTPLATTIPPSGATNAA